MNADPSASPAAVVIRTGILAAMAVAIAVGLWPISAGLLAALWLDQGLALIGRRSPLAWTLVGPLARLDQSWFGRHWKAVVTGAKQVQAEPGIKNTLRRMYRKTISVSAILAQWSPFVLFGISGPAFHTTWMLDAFLVAVYPLLSLSYYAECSREVHRHAKRP